MKPRVSDERLRMCLAGLPPDTEFLSDLDRLALDLRDERAYNATLVRLVNAGAKLRGACTVGTAPFGMQRGTWRCELCGHVAIAPCYAPSHDDGCEVAAYDAALAEARKQGAEVAG